MTKGGVVHSKILIADIQLATAAAWYTTTIILLLLILILIILIQIVMEWR